MTERVRSQVQASEMRFSQKIKGVTLFKTMCSFGDMKISQHRAVTSQIERSQLRWFGDARKHNTSERLPKQALPVTCQKQMGKDLLDDPRTRWTNYIDDLGWNRLGLYPSEMMDVMEDWKCDGLISSCCPYNPHDKAGNEEKKKIKQMLLLPLNDTLYLLL